MGVDTPSQNRLPLTILHFQLKIDIFTSKRGNQEAYHGKHHAYQNKDAYYESL